ncbi:hypothetical protein SAMCFNEI73_Ch3683 [Sinorhizobium americanum]|uniref:Uncharacterized protein n=1 Tax=Sinorhizobium americanum TaxID=194963 RepID=A0A1L3LS79_9HYPH|nr:hypothetical protein SAMCFNEI73_Ch3683 [Sinorhizobium americanum]
MTRTNRQSYHANVLNRCVARVLLRCSIADMAYNAGKSVGFGGKRAEQGPPLDLW